jgi:uncharacterized cupin superfamily protein
MADMGDGIYVSRIDTDEWTKDPDVGGSAHLLFEEDDGTTAGLWRADPDDAPGPAPDVEIPLRETVLVLEGQVRVRVDGRPPLELTVGDFASFPKGALIGWDPSHDCKVFWVYS